MDDLIKRQDAVDAIDRLDIPEDMCVFEILSHIELEIGTLPSAQPEIIRCKDCKHWDGVDTCDVIDAPVWDNDFCSMAERRNDE